MSIRRRRVVLLVSLAMLSARVVSGQRSRGEPPFRDPEARMPATTSASPPIGSPTRMPNPRPTVGGGVEMLDSAIVDVDEVRLIIEPLGSAWRYNLHGGAGFFSWRIDVSEGGGLALALAADTMMRSTNAVRMVNGSTLRLCQNPKEPSVRSCTAAVRGDVRARDNYVQFTLKDSAVVAFFRKTRPSHLYGTTFEPMGKFRVDAIPVAYRDDQARGQRVLLKR